MPVLNCNKPPVESDGRFVPLSPLWNSLKSINFEKSDRVIDRKKYNMYSRYN